MGKSNNEARLLIILASLLMAVLCFNLVIKPLKTDCDDLESKVNTEDALVRSMYKKILSYDENYETYQNACKQIDELSDVYYTEADQEEYLETVFNMLGDINFVLADSADSEEILLTNKETDPNDRFALDVSGIDITAEAEGTFDQFRTFTGQVIENKKLIVFRSLKMDKNKTENGDDQWKMSGTLNFYSIDNIAELSAKADNTEPLAEYNIPEDFIDMSYKNTFANSGAAGSTIEDKLKKMITSLKKSITKPI